jgi:hypothetical protein
MLNFLSEFFLFEIWLSLKHVNAVHASITHINRIVTMTFHHHYTQNIFVVLGSPSTRRWNILCVYGLDYCDLMRSC